MPENRSMIVGPPAVIQASETKRTTTTTGAAGPGWTSASMAVGPEEDEAGRGGCLWVQVRRGQCTRAEQPRSDGGKDVGEEGSERTEVDTSVTVAAGGEITGISGRGIMPRLIFAGMQALDTKTQE